jgi:hypothetical protein
VNSPNGVILRYDCIVRCHVAMVMSAFGRSLAGPLSFSARRQLVTLRRMSSGAVEVFQFGCAFFFTQNYLITSQQCVGPSMMPTLGLAGDVVLMTPTAGGLARPKIGDVVICASPTDPMQTVCKRVLGA